MNAGSAAEYVFSGIPVTNYGTAAAWYETLFGRKADVIVRDDIECMWEIREGAWIYIVLDPARAGKSLVTILVRDLESTLHQLSGRGMAGWSIETRPGLYRKAILSDPDGNTVTYAQTLHEG